MPIITTDGAHHGEYELSDGMITVRYRDHEKATRAISAPLSTGPANEGLARIILSELVRESRS
jgi:hypothetical protein